MIQIRTIKKICEIYQNLSSYNMDVDNKKNLTQDVKQNLDDYRKKCNKIWKNRN